MRKNLTEIVFILDRSGSMNGLERDTIGGFNSMIEQQKKTEGEALISTVLFDNVSEVLHDRVDVKDIRPMTDRRNKNSQPYFAFCRSIICFTFSLSYRRLAFSIPSVVITNMVCSGTSSGRAYL